MRSGKCGNTKKKRTALPKLHLQETKRAYNSGTEDHLTCNNSRKVWGRLQQQREHLQHLNGNTEELNRFFIQFEAKRFHRFTLQEQDVCSGQSALEMHKVNYIYLSD